VKRRSRFGEITGHDHAKYAIRDWKAAMIRFTIQFEERMTQH
jgi:transposase-like protein